MHNALVRLGLSQTDAKVYINLATKGPQKAINIAQTLKMQEMQISSSLNKLQSKGVVNYTFEQTTLFSALPFEEALELLIQTHLRETKDIEQNKKAILAHWELLIKNDTAR